jgi:probable HAF family extracellular repeat protein
MDRAAAWYRAMAHEDMPMMKTLPRRCLLAAGACLFATAASAASYTITTFTVTGAKQTNPVAINDSGTVIGWWDDSQYQQHSFTYAGGKVTPFDPPGAVSSSTYGINKAGTIVGLYEDSAGIRHGYTDTAGKFTTVDMPGAAQTALNGINDKGEILGAAIGPDGTAELFTYANGTFTVIVPDTLSPVATAIAKTGAVAGWYPADPSYETAFRVTGGTITTIPAIKGVFYTQPFGISRQDEIVGQAALLTGEEEGFIWHKTGKVKLLQVAGSTDSLLLGINAAGVVVGSSFNSSYVSTGFVYDKGSFTMLTVPGSGVTSTDAISVNDAGTVLGDYVDTAGPHGFVAVPSP